MRVLCVVIYPMLAEQMAEMSDMFAEMGAFSEAFGMDDLGFEDFLGYFSLECGEIMGIGGAVFASLTGISLLSKEEKEGTAELLLTHPITRKSVVLSKLMALATQITALNLCVFLASAASVALIGEEVDMGKFILVFLSYFILQLQLGSMTFCISSFFRGKGAGIGIGLAMMLYFVNIVANITEEAKFLRYLTPFSYTSGAYIVENSALEWKFVAIGGAVAVISILLAFVKYEKKDIL